jgi:heme/copper-type cytochrome/quinol oxidase subunit 3
MLNLKKIFFFFLTLVLGFFFLVNQFFEYQNLTFNLRDSVFGSLFYFITGFHGLHVFIGLLFLAINFLILKKNLLLNDHHLSFEFSIIY